MTNSITRQLHVCFSRLMSCTSSSPFTHRKSHKPDTVLSPPSSPSPSTPSSPAFVFHNYNSLYDPAASDSDTQAASNSATFTTTTTTATLTPPADPESDPDISSAIASRRLLPPSSPGRSNAIADPSAFAFGIGVAVPTYSPDPYGDFRTSMEEMAAAMGMLGPQGGTRGGRRRRRERLYELLLCYLALNRKHAHKYIVGAFADLLVAIADDGEEPEEEEDDDDKRRVADSVTSRRTL